MHLLVFTFQVNGALPIIAFYCSLTFALAVLVLVRSGSRLAAGFYSLLCMVFPAIYIEQVFYPDGFYHNHGLAGSLLYLAVMLLVPPLLALILRVLNHLILLRKETSP